jgi:hypothetical protein
VLANNPGVARVAYNELIQLLENNLETSGDVITVVHWLGEAEGM